MVLFVFGFGMRFGEKKGMESGAKGVLVSRYCWTFWASGELLGLTLCRYYYVFLEYSATVCCYSGRRCPALILAFDVLAIYLLLTVST